MSLEAFAGPVGVIASIVVAYVIDRWAPLPAYITWPLGATVILAAIILWTLQYWSTFPEGIKTFLQSPIISLAALTIGLAAISGVVAETTKPRKDPRTILSFSIDRQGAIKSDYPATENIADVFAVWGTSVGPFYQPPPSQAQPVPEWYIVMTLNAPFRCGNVDVQPQRFNADFSALERSRNEYVCAVRFKKLEPDTQYTFMLRR